MTTSAVVAIVLAVGGLLPLLTALAQQPWWSPSLRTVVGVAVSLIAGLVTYVSTYGLDLSSPARIVSVVVGVILAAATAYKTIWQPAGVAPHIERSTSPKRKAP